jgi:tetratricopeptide (TPR) repeat protein
METSHRESEPGAPASVDVRAAQGVQIGDYSTQTNIFQVPRWEGQRPRQLPAAVAHFAGRSGELAMLTGLLTSGAQLAGTVVISAIGGTAGVGKTALAVHWAHMAAEEFPDGQLYVNLRGFDPGGQVMEPAEAVRRFLDALGIPADRIPVDLDAQAALYRSELSGRRILVVLDNARDTAQVRPLLPGAPGCRVIVTSRNQLSGLVAADGAVPIALGLLTAAEARELLARRLGPDRVAADPESVEEIITRCARLPLPLAIVAARAVTDPHRSLRTLADELRDARDRLDALTTDDAAIDIRAVFSWSYRALSADAALLFRLLGLHPGPDLSAAAMASLAAVPPSGVRRPLNELARAHLIVEPVPGRYTFHDLLRAYAADLARTIDPDELRRNAIGRMLDHYLHSGYAAGRLLNPIRDPITVASPRPGVIPEYLKDHSQAVGWLTTEHPVLLAAIDQAAAAGFDAHAWQLAWTLTDFLDLQGHWHDWIASHEVAVAAAQRLADPPAMARAHRLLANAYTRRGRFDDAHTHLRQALDFYLRADDLAGQANTHHNLAFLLGRQDEVTEALSHAQQALDLYREARHQHGQANALNAVGWYHALLSDHQHALTACQQALTLHQKLGNLLGQADAWDSLGYAHQHLGHHAEAANCYQQALSLHRNLGDQYNEAITLGNIGDAHHANGDAHAARETWQQALTILDHLHHTDADKLRTKLDTFDGPTDTDASRSAPTRPK